MNNFNNMENNKKRYWLNTGILFAFISLVIGSLVLIHGNFWVMATTHGLIGLPWLIPLGFLSNLFLSNSSWLESNTSMFFFGTINYFLIGSLIGYFYGKIKDR